MSANPLAVVYEDNHLLAVAKPAGVATMGAAPGEPSVVEAAKAYLKRRYDKPGAVYLGVVSRLDKPVTGVLLFARTSKAAARLTDAFRARRVSKAYLATVTGRPPNGSATLVHHLRMDEPNRRVYATHDQAPGAKRAELAYRTLRVADGKSLLLVEPHTGRKHQIRVQLAKHGVPILGDTKYGGPPSSDTSSIALHAWRLALEHPVRRAPLALESPPPSRWGGWRRDEIESALEQAGGPQHPHGEVE